MATTRAKMAATSCSVSAPKREHEAIVASYIGRAQRTQRQRQTLALLGGQTPSSAAGSAEASERQRPTVFQD
jgi:hypothetical protein